MSGATGKTSSKASSREYQVRGNDYSAFGDRSPTPSFRRNENYRLEFLSRKGERKDEALYSPETVVLTGDQAQSVRFVIDGIPGAGKYEAKLQFQSAGSTPLEKTYTLLVRESCLLAAALIALGVVLSGLLRQWVNQEKPRLARIAQVNRLARELESVPATSADTAEQEVIARARALLEALLFEVETNATTVNDAAIERLLLRVSAIRAFVPLRAAVRTAPEPARGQFLEELNAIAADLKDSEATLEQLKGHQTTLRQMPSKLRAAVETQRVMARLDSAKNKLSDQISADLEVKVKACVTSGEYERAMGEISAVAASQGVQMSLPGPGVGNAGGFVMPKLPTVLESTTRLLERGKWTEGAINAIIGFIAVLLGLKALYVDDLSWGGAGSMLIAFLWGLGLHQFTYGGVGSVLDKVARGGASA